MDTFEPCTGLELIIPENIIVDTLQKHVRVNKETNSVEFYNDYGVKMVLRNLSDKEIAAYSILFKIY